MITCFSHPENLFLSFFVHSLLLCYLTGGGVGQGVGVGRWGSFCFIPNIAVPACSRSFYFHSVTIWKSIYTQKQAWTEGKEGYERGA